MFKQIKKVSKQLIEGIRTAPVGTGYYVGGLLYMPTYNYYTLIIGGIAALVGVLMIRTQFNEKNRLEKLIREEGYKDRIFKPTISEWCARQTARVVAKKYNCLDQYTELCENNKAIQELYFLKHI